MRRFNLYQRGKFIYCRFKNQSTGTWTTGISTGETDREAATAWAYHALKYGIPEKGNRRASDIVNVDTILNNIRNAERIEKDDAGRILAALENRGLIISAAVAGSEAVQDTADFLTDFWTWETSPYVREKKSRGHSLGREHVDNRLRHIRNYWAPAFSGVRLIDLTRTAVRDFADSLADTGLAPQTRNHVLLAGTVAFRWAYDREILTSDVTAGIRQYAGKSKNRGTLTLPEVEALFALEWPEPHLRLANLTAAFTGLRAGELAALRLQDIGKDRLFVRHSWNRTAGLKDTKTGEAREVPILPTLRDELKRSATASLWPVGPSSWVFWSPRWSDKPLHPRSFAVGLDKALLLLDGCTVKEIATAQRAERKEKPTKKETEALQKVRDSREKWRARNIVFHSWRHFYAATLAGKLDARTVMSATGHRSESVFAQYSDHINAERFQKVAKAAGESFGRIVRFPGTGTE